MINERFSRISKKKKIGLLLEIDQKKSLKNLCLFRKLLLLMLNERFCRFKKMTSCPILNFDLLSEIGQKIRLIYAYF
jgi:hypothetical protein